MTCSWAFEKSRPADIKNVAALRVFLDNRISLGWTDLDAAMRSALDRCGPHTQVVYIGDGISTAPTGEDAASARFHPERHESGPPLPPGEGRGEGSPPRTLAIGNGPSTAPSPPAPLPKGEGRVYGRSPGNDPLDNDPAAFAASLRRMAAGRPGTFHAVAVSSSFEPLVMKAIASVGGGSFRQVAGSNSPSAVAAQLLGEMTQPALRDLKVEFRGLRTARVYPEELPNLELGSQQIILGRYLPDDRDHAGEVIVTGTQAGKPVRFTAAVTLKDAEQGNSFIPRLWARLHLDSLLQQGSSAAIRDEIIALSEEHHLITPYTSLLVLESDADRERFGVRRRFQMRDGEKFFAQGRDNANWELVQQQMQRAGTWRVGLRRDVLRQLGALGRQTPGTPYIPGACSYVRHGDRGFAMGGMGGDPGGVVTNGGALNYFGVQDSEGAGGSFAVATPQLGGYDATQQEPPTGRVMLGVGVNSDAGLVGNNVLDEQGASDSWDADGPVAAPAACAPASLSITAGEKASPEGHAERGEAEDEKSELGRLSQEESVDGDSQVIEYLAAGQSPVGGHTKGFVGSATSTLDRSRAVEGMPAFCVVPTPGRRSSVNDPTSSAKIFSFFVGFDDHRDYGVASAGWSQPTEAWLDELFPALPPPPAKEKEPEPRWPAEARALAERLVRSEQLAAVNGGLQIDIQSQTFDPRWNELSGQEQTSAAIAPTGWLVTRRGDRQQTSVAWCDAHQRGVISKAFELGRVRKSTLADVARPPVDLGLGTMTRLDRAYAGYAIALRPQADRRTLLVLTRPDNERDEVHILVDTARMVVLRLETRQMGKVTSTTTLGDFIQLGGAWWAGRIETDDADGHRTALVAQKFTDLAPGRFTQLEKDGIADRQHVLLLEQPLPSLIEAKRAAAAGKARFEDQIVLMLHFQATQQWQRVLDELGKAEKLVADKPGRRWIRSLVLTAARRHDEVKQRYFDEAATLVKGLGPQATPDEAHLADFMVDRGSSLFEANEMLALLGVLKVVYDRQPTYLEAPITWQQRRINYLEHAGQSPEALRLRKQLAEQYPRDAELQRLYAQGLVQAGQYADAYAWIDRVLTSDIHWLPAEEQSLRSAYADWLRAQGRYADLLEYLAAWVRRNPPDATAYQQYLSALVWNDRPKEAERLMARWIEEGKRPDTLPPEVASRLQAAVSHALGQGCNFYVDRIDPEWLKTLARAAIFFARHPSQGGIADQIMGNSAFQQSDPCRDVRRQALKILHDDLSKLTPVEIARLVSWINAGDPAIEAPEWQRLAAGLRERWTNEAKPELQQQLGQTLVTVLSGHADATALLRFLQQQYEHGLEEHRAAYASQWFDTLLRQPWSAAHEDAAFALLEKLSDAEEPAVRLAAAVAGLHRLTDRMVQARFQAAIGKVEHQEKLTRTELRVKREENLQAARHGFIERLRQAAKQSSRGLSRVSSVVSERDAETGTVPFTRWLSVERLYLQVLVGKQLDKVAEECFELLGPPTAGKKDANSPDGDVAQRLEEMLHHRYLVTLMNLAARKTAKPELAPRVLAYLEQTAAAEPQEPRWKLMQYQLLVALDRPRDLQKKLQGWIGEGTVPSFVRRLGTRRRNWDCPPPAIDPNYWRLSLAYLLAEQGRIAEAIALFEAIAAADELSAADYRTLADWYLVVGRRPEHERAMIAALKATDQWRLYRWLYAELQPWQRTDAPPPRELDPQVPLAFAALLEKADQQQDYLGLLRQFYQTTRDFRLLAGLADAVVGHTAGHVYPMLQGMGPVLAEIRDEATADSLVEQLAQVRRWTKTDVDRRALDLLEMLVERRAAELQNQPGPHVARALAALERSWKRQWTAGEPRWMADLLASLGHISQPELAQEQLRELTSLHRDAATGSIDRLHIAHALARAQWSYDRQQEAIDLLSSALDEYEAACGGTLPVEANEPFSTMISYLEQRRNYARGEDRLFAQLKHPANPQQRDWLGEQLYQLYQSAIAGDGEVLLGVGAALYEAVQQKLFDELKTADDNHRSNLLSRLLTIYRTAHGKKLPGPVDVVADLRRFAFHRLPEVLTRQNNNYDNLVSQTGQTLHDLVGPRDGLAFLIQQIEATPTWLCYNGQDGWSRFAWTLGEWRPEAKDLGDLEPRLLRIVLAELREDLRSRQSRHRVIYDRRYGYWWAEKENDFARVADEVLAKDRQSAAATVYIAEYLYWGLNRYGRAIDVLLDAHRRELLDEAGQATLVDYLQRQSRFAESIAVLEPLVQRRPDNLDYRVQLMRAYFHVNRQADLLALLKKTDGYFHQPGRWQEPVMRALAASCLENHLFAQSVAYYREVISLHQRTAPRRGIGDGALANYYGGLARAYGGLKQTGDAVDAACGAVVSWGPRQQNRVEALDSLRQVLRQAPDLDAYVAQLDRQTAASGQDNPIVRKAIGQIYLEKQQYPRAITQLSTAAALQPNDAETHRALLDCFDRQHDQPGAIEQLLRNRELAGRDMNLYEDLGRRFETLGRSDQADRAYTSIVEMLPSEAESHRRLAEIRQRQNRWEDAIAQWQQVARLGELEPTGLLGLTTALLHQNHHEAAAAALAKLKGRTWPPRFADAEEKFRRLQQQIESKAAMP